MINTILQSTAGWLRMVFQFVFKRYCCFRGSRPEVFLRKGVLKICRKFTGEHPCRSVISIKLQSNFIEITLRHGCFPVNLLHIFRTSFLTLGGCLFCFRPLNTVQTYEKRIFTENSIKDYNFLKIIQIGKKSIQCP